MKPKEKIEKAAREYSEKVWKQFEECSSCTTERAFIAGANSSEAKELHTEGMYSRKRVIELINISHYDRTASGGLLYMPGKGLSKEWIEQNL